MPVVSRLIVAVFPLDDDRADRTCLVSSQCGEVSTNCFIRQRKTVAYCLVLVGMPRAAQLRGCLLLNSPLSQYLDIGLKLHNKQFVEQ